MPRPLRAAPGGMVYHVLNRANAKRRIFEHAGDYLAFESTLSEVQQRIPMRILAWCVMPNHWHLMLWPLGDGELSSYLRLVTLIHTQRWHANRASAGSGHLYQGRFKSFVVQDDAHFLAVCRYVEANALNAGLVSRAEDWHWGSLWHRARGASSGPARVDDWPVPRPADWTAYVNESPGRAEMEAVRNCARRGTPYGEASWRDWVAAKLGLDCTLRPRGRPKKDQAPEKGPDPFSCGRSGPIFPG